MKVTSENTEDIVTFLREIKKLYGLALACVHDMGQGICAAIAIVFPGVLDFIRHFHFLRDLGKDLFEEEHATMRRWLQSYGAKTIFRSAQKELFQIINQRPEFQEEIAHYMEQHQQGVPKESLSAVVKTYLMVAWMLAFKRELKGLGFPFDRQHLLFYQRIKIDPIEVKTPHGKQWIQPQRTNNAMEQFFREEKRKGRKKSGTSSLTKSFKAILADTPLIQNLSNPQYMNILLKSKSSLVERFAQIDAALVRQEMQKHQQEWRDLPKGLKNILKIADLPQKLFQ